MSRPISKRDAAHPSSQFHTKSHFASRFSARTAGGCLGAAASSPASVIIPEEAAKGGSSAQLFQLIDFMALK